MKNFVQLKNVLLGGASLVAVSVVMAPALAQENMETVVVTGIRASLQSAQSIKQNSDQVVDSITAVDIGALPDRSVAEALQRVPGVQLTRTDALRDPVRYGGTGNGVFIRGLSWVSALTNGRDTFSAANGRTLSFADISADLLAGVDVYKNPNAKMIEGAIGGTVDLKTRKPFDQDGRILAISADATYGTLSDAATPTVNVLASNRWNTKIGEIGALLSVDYQVQKNRTNSMYTNRYDTTVTLPSGATGHLPSDTIGWRSIDWTQQRLALDGSLQWRPNEKWELTATAIYSKADPHEGEYAAALTQPTAYSPDLTFASDGTWTGGKLANDMMLGNDTRDGVHHNSNADFSLNAKFTPTDALTITADVQYSESRAYMRSMATFLNTRYSDFTGAQNFAYFDHTWSGLNEMFPGAPVLNPVLNFGGDTPTVTYSDADKTAIANPANNYFGAAMDHLENNYAHNWATRIDATYTVPGDGLFGLIRAFDVGYRNSEKQAVTRQTGWNWHELSYEWWIMKWCGCDDARSRVIYADNSAIKSHMVLRSFDQIFGNNLPAIWAVNANELMGDTKDAYKLLLPTDTSGNWKPYAAQHASCKDVTDYKCMAVYDQFHPEADNVNGGINNQKEEIHSGYVMADYAHDTFLGFEVPIDGNVGVRIVSTKDTIGAGYFILPSVAACDATKNTNGCGDRNNAFNFVGNSGAGGTTLVPATTHSYTDVTPSFNFRAHMTDQLQLRLAYSQAIVRPDFAFTQNYTSLAFSFQDGDASAGNFKPGGLTGTGGNPNLKPMHAQQYDASLEWFFSPTGSVSLALFHKDLSNYFLTASEPETYTRNGVSYTFGVTRTYNAAKGKVEGFELAYQQFYDSLPGLWGGFGIQANYTKIYNSGGGNAVVNVNEAAQLTNHAIAGLPIEGMSNDSANLALLYAKYGIDARLAYNWRSRYLMTSSAANVNQPVWARNFGQLDGSVFYSFLEHYKVGAQITNILNTTQVLDVGYVAYHPRYDWISTDRKISLIVRANW